MASKVEELSKNDFVSFCEGLYSSSSNPRVWLLENKELFAQRFSNIQNKFAEGLEKAVPTVTSYSENAVSNEELGAILANLAKVSETTNSFGVSYGFWDGSTGVVGRSPEILVEVVKEDDADSVSTMALAGTALAREKRSLLCDPKEKHEHQLVVDDLSDQLSAWGEVKVSETKEVRAGSLKHLRTDISVKTKNLDQEEAIDRLHPTPALGVKPRGFESTQDFLKSLCDEQNRYGFGAPFALVSKEYTKAIVAIRNIHWNENKTFLYTGCGIVPESKLENEWAELANKRKSVLQMLGLQ